MNPFASLTGRILQEEEMDAIDLPDARYVRVLRHLSRVNLVTLAHRPTLAFFNRVIGSPATIRRSLARGGT